MLVFRQRFEDRRVRRRGQTALGQAMDFTPRFLQTPPRNDALALHNNNYADLRHCIAIFSF
jgi:hypothetical protein